VKDYDAHAIEQKWQSVWEAEQSFHVDNPAPGEPVDDEHFYMLEMLPYPSGSLHMGHVLNYTLGDVVTHFKRRHGYKVLRPMGFDSFGLPAENAAIKDGGHPLEITERNMEAIREQMRLMGWAIDWQREVSAHEPSYYRWTQWLFLKFFEHGLAYRKEAPVKWCPNDQTVLANEQVIDGRCERCDTPVEQRFLDQWFFRITNYTERLLENLPNLDWSSSTVLLQKNWIGRSEGAELIFETPSGKKITVFTTRPDTVFGATYLVLAPEHPLVDELTAVERRSAVKAYQREVQSKDIVSRRVGDKTKSGVFIGSYARNPATGEAIPIWIADYVLMEYGTGAIMAVPAHDKRDFEFATQFELPILQVVAVEGQTTLPTVSDGGVLMNSAPFDGMSCVEGGRKIVAWLAERGLATPRVQYRLHDWCISRQRYWGPPIPIIYCEKCGVVPVPEKDLPVELPLIEDFRPDDTGVSPLARHEEWYFVKCPQCGGQARRETDVSDTFLDSAWYHLRYPSTEFHDRPFDPARTKKWLPVSSYIGGNEHAVLHLLYSRFVCMVLADLGHLHFDTPYPRFRAHGLIVKDGAKMSKSRGNVVVPDAYIQQWGADTFRMYLMFLGPFQEGGDFRDSGIVGQRRFLEKVWALVHEAAGADVAGAPELQQKLHRTIRKVSADTEALQYNTAIAAMMEYVNELKHGAVSKALVEPLVIMLAPYAPHIAEELWSALGNATPVFAARWPAYDERLASAGDVEIAVQVNGKLRSRLTVPRGMAEKDVLDRVLADEAVKKFVDGQKVKKVIYVQDRLVNLVV